MTTYLKIIPERCAMAMIELRDVTKKYGNSKVIRGLTFSVEKGESFALLGPNGVGKTTLVRILSTLIRPTSGTIKIDGVDISDEPQEVKARIGVVSHNPFLYDDLTARENLEFYSDLYDADKANVPALLERVNLKDRSDDLVGTFSRGMKQRLSIARSILHDPGVLILDEPTGGLDIKSREDFFTMIEDLGRHGVTILLTTHHMDVAERLCDRAAVMDKGAIVEVGTMDEIKADVETLEDAYMRLTGEAPE
jgi:heme ABC exporter ATP-binding subunit CcmA